MLLGEPQRTQGDLNFSLFGIPVRVHPFFWLVALLLGMSSPDVRHLLSWVAALFVCILFHELGHATAMLAYGFRPWITLYGMGGLTSYDQAQQHRTKGSGPLPQVLISAAGPAAGFLLAAVIVAGIILTGYRVGFELGGQLGVRILMGLVGSELLTNFLFQMLFINIIWGLVNLLPIYPLDGGRISREVFLLLNPHDGIRQSLILSIIAAVGIALLAVTVRELFIVLLFGYLAYSSFAMLQMYTSHRGW